MDILEKQDEYMRKKRPEAKHFLQNHKSKTLNGGVNVALHLAETLKLDPEWLWLDDAIFSNQDQNEAFVEITRVSRWWEDDLNVDVCPQPEPTAEDRVEKYLKDSR